MESSHRVEEAGDSIASDHSEIGWTKEETQRVIRFLTILHEIKERVDGERDAAPTIERVD